MTNDNAPIANTKTTRAMAYAEMDSHARYLAGEAITETSKVRRDAALFDLLVYLGVMPGEDAR